MRNGIRRFLSDYPEIQVIGEACSFPEMLQMITSLRPSVVLLDLRMPNPADLPPERIRAACQDCRVVALSIYASEEWAILANRFGAATFLDKATLVQTLVPAIQG